MANAQLGNKVYIDSTGSATTTRSKIVYAMFTPSSADDSVVLRENGIDQDALVIQAATAKDTKILRFSSQSPVVFSNGINVQSISSGAKLVLILTTGGGE